VSTDRSTYHVQIDLDRGVSFEKAEEILALAQSEGEDCDCAFYRSKKETAGRGHLLILAKRYVDPTQFGRQVNYTVCRPNTGYASQRMNKNDLLNNYNKMPMSDAVQGEWSMHFRRNE
jgi:hypothetical protein